MKTLTVKLKQHTPLIHFQPNEIGAKLRASELKPKLDRYILTQIGEGDLKKGIEIAKVEGLLLGEHPALNYKLRITASGKDKLPDIKLSVRKKGNGEYESDKFPLLLSNMGGRDSEEELVNLSMYKYITLKILTNNQGVYDKLDEYIPVFITDTNFGQRSNKGFGSFSPYSIADEEFEEPNLFIDESSPYMEFTIGNSCDEYMKLASQKKLFTIIEKFWSDLRNYIKNDNSTNKTSIERPESYIRAMKTLSPEKSSKSDFQRMPAPIIFKPIWLNDGNTVRVYIIPDRMLIKKIQDEITTNNSMISPYTINTSNLSNLSYIKKYMKSIINPQYKNWSVKVGKDYTTGRNIYIKIKFKNI